MKTDYKFHYILRKDDVHISEAAIRFYEGDITTENETFAGETKPVTRYRRTKRLKIADLPHHKNKKTKKEASGEDTIVFTTDDFGIISTDDELRIFLNKELAEDKTRTPIPEQI